MEGPFTVTKIPNRFQIEYLDGSVTRLTHISYAKKYNERCHYTGIPRQAKVSRRRTRARMARLRLILGNGRHKMQRVVNSISNIQEKWPIHSGRLCVRILGEAKDLPADLQAIVEATDPDNCIAGSVLVDLCRQRSETSEELPMPMASSPKSPTPPAVQVKQYSWRHNAIPNECSYDKRREFVDSGKQTNHVSLLLPQQAPLVSQAHLLSVVRKVGKSERVKGKLQQEFVIKSPSPHRGKTMTSLFYSRQKSEGKDQQCSINTERSKSETNQFIPIYQYKTNIYTLKPSDSGKEQRGIKFKRPGSANGKHSDDVISDGINQGLDVNRLIARKRYATTKHSFSHTKEFLKATLNICKQSFIQLAMILAVVISLIGSGLNMNLLKLVCTAGLAVVVCQECGNNSNGTLPLAISVLVYAILPILRESTAAITNISKVLGSCIPKVMVFDNKKQLT